MTFDSPASNPNPFVGRNLLGMSFFQGGLLDFTDHKLKPDTSNGEQSGQWGDRTVQCKHCLCGRLISARAGIRTPRCGVFQHFKEKQKTWTAYITFHPNVNSGHLIPILKRKWPRKNKIKKKNKSMCLGCNSGQRLGRFATPGNNWIVTRTKTEHPKNILLLSQRAGNYQLLIHPNSLLSCCRDLRTTSAAKQNDAELEPDVLWVGVCGCYDRVSRSLD